MFDATRGCDEGLLELIPDGLLAPGADGSPAGEDFWPEALTDCGVGNVFYSTVVAYHPDRSRARTGRARGLLRPGALSRPARNAPQSLVNWSSP